jgi:hypothetical protein
MHVGVLNVAVENNKYYILRMVIYSLNYPAYNVHMPYYVVISGLSVSTLFYHIIS